MYGIYQVEYGDTIDSIAKKVGTSPSNIKRINSFVDNSNLIVGSLIVVPKSENEKFEIYEVREGDSIYSISRIKNLDPDIILLLNGLDKDDIIYPNQEIIVPKENILVYVTRQGDTISSIINKFNIDANTISNENEKIFVLEDQLIVHEKEQK